MDKPEFGKRPPKFFGGLFVMAMFFSGMLFDLIFYPGLTAYCCFKHSNAFSI
jgi:hypothetical protein